MGYACPVCAEPQADGEHLANHLAFSAMLGRADHADWLDEHAPGWGEEGPAALAERVAPEADEIGLPGVDDDGELPDPPAGAGRPAGAGTAGLEDAIARGAGPGRERLDPETREVIAEAREMTGRRRADETAGGEGKTGEDDGEGAPADGSERDGSGPDSGDGDGSRASAEPEGEAADEKP